jgi:hypothetical protein
MQNKNHVHTLLIALIGTTFAAGSPAFAYDYDHCVGDRVDWGRTAVSFYPSRVSFPNGNAESLALDAAFDAWNNHAPGTKFRFAIVYDDVATWTSGDGKNSVGFTYSYDWGTYTLAVTLRRQTCYWWGSGDIKEADVLFRPGIPWTFVTSPPSPPSPSPPYNLTLVAIHELGHAFGLNHQKDAIATMNDLYPDGGTLGNFNLIHPHSDDIYGNRVGYGTCCTDRDVYANAYRSTSSTSTDWIPAPSLAYTGLPVSFQFTIGNRGTTNEGSARVQFYLSTDRFISTSDTYLGAATFSLNSGGTGTFNASATIPVSLPSGTYYLGWIVDPLGSIPEVDESNNAVALVSSTSVMPGPVCGNSVCDAGESNSTCPSDCPPSTCTVTADCANAGGGSISCQGACSSVFAVDDCYASCDGQYYYCPSPPGICPL